jgi:SulP family sulfate permease
MPSSPLTEASETQRFPGLVRELRPGRLVPNLTTGLVLGVLEVTVAISFAALIFGGELSQFVSSGVGFMLFSAIVICLLIALLSSVSGALGGIQDAPAAILSVVSAGIAVSMPAGASTEETFLTVVVAVAVSSLLTGLFLFALGALRSGELVRFLPYPVVGGFLAGTGWLLVTGSISVMTDVTLSFSELGLLLQPEMLLMWLPGLALAVAFLLILERYNNAFIMPAMIGGAALLFYLFAWIAGASLAGLSSQGWLLGPFSGETLYRPLAAADLSTVYWPAILEQAGNIATILIVSVVALLFNASGIELVFKKDMDLNRELRAAGVANFVSGLGGGMAGFHALGSAALGYRTGVAGRLIGVTMATVCALVLVAGSRLLSLTPKFVLGGLLMYLGLSFLVEWLYRAWFKLPRIDYIVVVLILVVIAAFGFVPGVAVGLVAAVVFFVLNYSRTNVVRHSLSGVTFKSRVNREERVQEALREHGERIYILQLQGFIFFGTANSLLERVRARMRDPERPAPRFVILDFRQVTGLDSTAILSFNKMRQLAGDNEVVLAFAAMSTQIRSQFEAGGFDEEASSGQLSFCPDLDYAVEWCENRLLALAGVAAVAGERPIEEHLEALLPEGSDVEGLMRYLEPSEVAAGEYLMRQGDRPDDLYFIESGQVTALLESANREPIRLESVRGGHVVGEVGFFLGLERTASVVADEPSVVYRLTADSLRRMEESDKDAALALQTYMIALLAGRVAHLVGTVEAMRT